MRRKHLTRSTISVSDEKGGTDSITVTINVTNVNEAPSFTDGTSTARSIAENTSSGQNIGSPVSATDPDNDDLEYSLGGTDASSFSIVSTSGQLQTKAALDYETKTPYSVTISVSDKKGGTDSITVTINVTNVNEAPSFTDGTSTARSIAENTAANTNIGSPVSATDVDSGNTLTYTLGGTDAASFSIVSTSGQLQTNAALDYETKDSYTVTVSVSDGEGGSDSISVTINVTDVDENRAPSFTDGTSTARSIAENTGSGQNIGSPVFATDPDNDDLEYSLGGTDASSFSIVSTSGQLRTSASLNYESKLSHSVTISVSDKKGGTDSITVTINVMNVNEAPSFTDGTSTTRSIAENTAANTNIGSPVSATDVDSGNTLTYTLGGTDAASFSVVSTSGQLQTNAALDYETKSSYSVTVTATDDSGASNNSATITITISVTDVNENRAPTFTDSSIFYSISDIASTSVGDSIGLPITATDADGDTLTYSLNGDDASKFTIDTSSGQLKVSQALIDDTSSLYSIKVIATDPSSTTAEIPVTITVTRISTQQQSNNVPVFTDGSSTTRSIAENTAANTNIGSPVSATDVDSGNTLTYTLGGTDAASFSIVSTSGQLRTNAALDYETKDSYTVTVSVSDGNDGSDSITVTINVTDVDEIDPPLSERTTQVVNAIVLAVPGVTSADDVTAAHLAAIISLDIGGRRITSLKSGDFENLTSLTELSLSNNPISDLSPLQNLSNLTELSLRHNSISDLSPLQNLSNLTELSLRHNSISDLSPLQNLSNLETLSLSNNPISDISPLQNLTNLTTLYLYATSISDLSPLQNLTNLTELNLVLNSISDVSPLQNLRKLTELNLSDNSISDLSPLQNLRKLTELYLPNNSISDLSPLQNLRKLKTLSLGKNLISDLSPLQNLTNLRGFYLSENPISDYGPLRRLIAAIEAWGGSLNLDIEIPDAEGNNAPTFIDGATTTRSVAENAGYDVDVGSAVSATDPDNDDLKYSLAGTDAASFGINVSTGQLRTRESLNYESKSSYSVRVYVSDNRGGLDIITVTINVTDVDETYPLAGRTQQVQDAIVAAVQGVSSAADVTAAHLAAISSLDLHSRRITSLKSGDFDGLTSLEFLYLSDTSISDISSLSGLTSLTMLNLSDTSISDISSLSGLTSLKWLYLSDTSISDISSLSGLTSLTTLYLSDTSISDISPLSGLTSLKSLNLSDTSISDISSLSRLTSLTTLNLSDTSISDISSFSGLTSLKWLYLSDTSISDISPLSGLTSLEWLILSDTSISDISSLSRLTSLTTLYLSDTSISDISPLSGLTSLESLNLSDTSISDISPLSGLTSLTTLYLDNNSISDYGPLRILIAAIEADNRSLTLDITIPTITDSNAPTITYPPKSALLPNYPNPFNPETWIPYQLAKPAKVTLTIYNMRGVVIRELKVGHQAAGVYTSRSRAIHWDGRNNIGEKVATGAYFYTLKAGDFSATRKMLIRK